MKMYTVWLLFPDYDKVIILLQMEALLLVEKIYILKALQQ